MFYGRRTELNALNALFESGKFEFAVIYGRRRVGKTMLLNEFCEGRKAIFFTGIETSVSENLSQLSQTVLEYSGGGRFNFRKFRKNLFVHRRFKPEGTARFRNR